MVLHVELTRLPHCGTRPQKKSSRVCGVQKSEGGRSMGLPGVKTVLVRMMPKLNCLVELV